MAVWRNVRVQTEGNDEATLKTTCEKAGLKDIVTRQIERGLQAEAKGDVKKPEKPARKVSDAVAEAFPGTETNVDVYKLAKPAWSRQVGKEGKVIRDEVGRAGRSGDPIFSLPISSGSAAHSNVV